MDYAKRIGQVGALAVVLGVGAAVTTHAIGSAAPTDPSSSSTDSPVDACSPLGGSASSLLRYRAQCATGRRATGRPRKHPR